MLEIFSFIFYALRKRFYILRERLERKKSWVPYSPSARLRHFFEVVDISILDIGARRGPLDEFQFFAPFARLILCEPDAKEASRLETTIKSQGQWKDVMVITDAIDPRQQRVVLNITREEGLSSLLEPDEKILSQFYSRDRDKKYSFDDWEIVRQTEVPAISLDNAKKKYSLPDISLLKVDTQGTELGILESGAAHVLPGVVGVYVEAEFMPLYGGQALFGRVHDFLQASGFRLVDLKRSSLRRAFSNRPVYSKRELAWAHGLYLREKNADTTPLTPFQKIKLSCVAAHFEFFDYAIWLLRDASVAAFLRAHGLDDVEEDIRAYSAHVWKSIKKKSSLRQEKRLMSDSWNDRSNER